jgi:uncharacterized membrane protein YeaQ/YmgE (transglycosylase-associated protein family)
MLTRIFGGVIGGWIARHVASAGRGPGQFYYNHLFLLTSLIGALLAYWVCQTFSSRSAVWVWIPAVVAFAIWVAVWFSTRSVLFRESAIEHFITADCHVDRDAGFPARCADKLLFMPFIVAPVAYSVGAALQRLVAQRRRSDAMLP